MLPPPPVPLDFLGRRDLAYDGSPRGDHAPLAVGKLAASPLHALPRPRRSPGRGQPGAGTGTRNWDCASTSHPRPPRVPNPPPEAHAPLADVPTPPRGSPGGGVRSPVLSTDSPLRVPPPGRTRPVQACACARAPRPCAARSRRPSPLPLGLFHRSAHVPSPLKELVFTAAV